jgi:hypothetical protein
MRTLSFIKDKLIQDAIQTQNYCELGTCMHCEWYEARLEKNTIDVCEDCYATTDFSILDELK